MKRQLSVFFATLLLTSAASTVSAAESAIQVVINGQTRTFDQQPVIVNDRTLVPMRGIFEALGAQVNWDDATQTVTATKANLQVNLQINSLVATKNGTSINLDVPPKIINDRTMVPLRFVSESLGAKVDWNANDRSAVITSDTAAASSANLTPGSSVSNSTDSASSATNPAGSASQSNTAGNTSASNTTQTAAVSNGTSADSSNTNQLTYDAAVTMAMNSSYSLKNAAKDIERSKEVMDNVSDDVKWIPASGDNASAAKLYSSFATSQTSYLMSKKSYEMAQDAIAYAVKQAYNGVFQAQEALNLAQIAYQNADQQNRITQAKFQQGMASTNDQLQAQNNFKNADTSLSAAKKAMDDAYQKLDKLLGLPVDARPSLVDVPQMTNSSIDADVKVNQVINDSPNIWQAEQNVNLAQLRVDLYTFNDPSADPYKAKEIDVEKAKLSVGQLKDQLEKTVRSLYNAIKQEEDQYKGLQSKLQAAEDNLRVAKVKYDNGTGIQADVVAAQLAVEQIKQQMLSLAAQHDNNLMAFDKPWAASGGGQ
ncbi:stalk domain-containing protein [Effusibacillus dendaii]|uniref:Copper amine oxidase-like N-terminal domain-containing protein n=1 Tax=Effusibacillus dendaii TaxID=2743772 RepID=A0A7I8DFN4_9BACL|nr:stalk domain-containing protein [Effusibacillus dendaii]BCJ87759.1 hypothetical protein skT53_27440 [Effusibacillus dendaii]